MADSQGHHDDIKSFAATRAFEEERKKTNEQVLNLLGIPHADEARRKMTELVHDKVVTALGQQCQWGVKAGTEQSAELPPVELQDLIAEQRAYRRVGFTSEVFELQHAINNKRAEGQGDKAEEDDKLTKQRLMAMEMRQNKRVAELQQSQQAETEKLIDAQMRDYQQLLERQADEMHQLVENVTAMMTIGASWTPVVQARPRPSSTCSACALSPTQRAPRGSTLA